MKLIIILDNGWGELDRKEIEIKNGRDQDKRINLAVCDAIEEWTITPGDTIKIQEG